MLIRKVRNTLPYLIFEELAQVPDLIHAITIRDTDVAEKAQQSAFAPDSEKSALLGALRIDQDQVVRMKQIHSSRVISDGLAHPAWDGKEPPEADGVLLSRPNRYSVIQTADCLSILVIEPHLRMVCCLHAGWRGTLRNILKQGVSKLLQRPGTRLESVLIAFGPSIRSCCYRVGPEIREEFRKAGHQVDRLFRADRLDLVEANFFQLDALGIGRHQVLDCGLCTHCHPDLFYSYRREGATGRMWTVAGFRDF